MFRANVEETAEEMHPGHSTEPSEPGIALALGGGVAPGWAHIGVIRALEEAEIPIKMIAGTSIGALVGGCYLAGKLDELEKAHMRFASFPGAPHIGDNHPLIAN